MPKPPMIRQTRTTGLTAAEADMLQPDNLTVSIRNGKRTVEGYNQNGEKVVIQTTIINRDSRTNNGFRSQTVTVCDKLSISERREAVRRLKNEANLSQTEIARRLGVSQKTVSNDLNAE